MRFGVRLTPGAGADRIDRVGGGTLLVRVAARPVDGAANAALIRLLAAELGIAPGRISIVRGPRARVKTMEVSGLDAAALRSRWPDLDV